MILFCNFWNVQQNHIFVIKWDEKIKMQRKHDFIAHLHNRIVFYFSPHLCNKNTSPLNFRLRDNLGIELKGTHTSSTDRKSGSPIAIPF